MVRKNIVLCSSFFLFFLTSPQIASAEQIRLGIMPFTSKTDEVTERQTAYITDTITRTLQTSPTIAVIERERLRVLAIEQGLNLSSESKNSVTKLGQLAGCQYILLGSVTQLTIRYQAAGKSSSYFYNGRLVSTNFDAKEQSQEGIATLEARLIDVATGRVALSFFKSGSAFMTDEKSYSGKEFAIQAVRAASSRLADEVRKVLSNEHAMVIAINKNNIRINRGNLSGVNVGALYKVYQDGEELFDLNGKSLGKRIINLALLRVINVHDDFSNAEILTQDNANKNDNKKEAAKKTDKKTAKSKSKKTSKSKQKENADVNAPPVLIREGDKIEAITRTEADNLMKKGKLPEKRD